jgi:hypothetical protein
MPRPGRAWRFVGLRVQHGVSGQGWLRHAIFLHKLSTCFWIVFGDRFDTDRGSRNGRDDVTNCSPGGRSFSKPILKRASRSGPAVMFDSMAWQAGSAGLSW